MTYRRTWFSCVLCFLYTVLCIILIVTVGKVWLLDSVGTITPQAIYVVLLIPVAALYWIIRGVSTRIRERWTWDGRAALITICAVYLMIMAFALFIRIDCLKYYVSYMEIYGSDGVNIEQMNLGYYDMAVLAEQNDVSPMDYGISDLYVMFLSVVLSFLGNKIESVVCLQIILQIVSMVVAYAVVRKVAGRLPACISILYLAGSLTCLGMLFRFGPEWLFFILYMAGMLAAVSFVKRYCEDELPRHPAIAYAIMVGAMIGVLAYLDLIGASLLAVMLIAAVGKKTGSETIDCHNYSKGMNVAVIGCAYLACAVVWLGAMSVVSHVKGTDVVSDILDRLQMFYRSSSLFTSAPYAGAEHYPDLYLVGVLIVFSSFLIFEFFRRGRDQNYMMWILMCLLVAPTPMSVYGEHGFRGLSMYVWAVLAGLGLQNCIFGDRAKVMQPATEEINADAEKTEEINADAEKAEEINPNPEKAEESGQMESPVSVVETVAEEQQTEVTESQEPKPRFIENPLPLPKKHVAREMDYQYDIEEKDMKYDVEVPDDDDFDLQ